jgi:hypothetical protein
MNIPVTFRVVAVCALVVGLFLTLPGCGGSKPQASKAEEKKADPKGDPKGDGGSKVEPVQPPRKVDPTSGVGKDAFAFLKALGEGAAKADHLSTGFVKMVGLPAELPSDKAKGYSTGAAESWMKRIGANATFGLPSGFAAADVAVLWGGFQEQGRKGDYSLRLINESGTWKVDYFALSSAAHSATAGASEGPEAEYQRFAARAIGGLLCDKSGMPKDERAMALAAGLTPAFRGKLAEPFGSDKDQGFDYNRGKLNVEADKIGSGAESYSTTRQASATDFRLEVTKSGGAKAAYLVKLVKGATPGQWLVESITPQ